MQWKYQQYHCIFLLAIFDNFKFHPHGLQAEQGNFCYNKSISLASSKFASDGKPRGKKRIQGSRISFFFLKFLGECGIVLIKAGANFIYINSILLISCAKSSSLLCYVSNEKGDKCPAWAFIRNGAPGKDSGCLLKNQIPLISNTTCVPYTSDSK